MVHASFNKYEFLTKEFIVKRIENSFIGEPFDEFNQIYGEAVLYYPPSPFWVKVRFYKYYILNLLKSIFSF